MLSDAKPSEEYIRLGMSILLKRKVG